MWAKSAIVAGFGVLGGIVGYLYGGWSLCLETLLFFNALDLATGVLVGLRDGKIESPRMLVGILKKLAMWLALAVAYRVDVLLFKDATVFISGAFLFIANEGLSIVENLGKLGIETEFLSKYLKQVRKYDKKGK